jgi:hypothetical protein
MKRYIIRICSLEDYVEVERDLTDEEYALLVGIEHEVDEKAGSLTPYIQVLEKA